MPPLYAYPWCLQTCNVVASRRCQGGRVAPGSDPVCVCPLMVRDNAFLTELGACRGRGHAARTR